MHVARLVAMLCYISDQVSNIVYGGADLKFTEYFAPAIIIG